MSRSVTRLLLLAVAVGLVGWDIYVATNSVDGDTISEVVLDLVWKRPVLPFAFGVICGHLFWPQRIPEQP